MPVRPNSQKTPARPHEDERCGRMRDHLAQARNLLCLANRKGILIPREVVTAVLETDRACGGGATLDLELEARFWDAYGLLRRTIEPATRARRFYRVVFYCALLLMLLVQAGYLIGSQALQHLAPEAAAPAITSALLKTGLEFVAAYLLPVLYGLLGACAFVLRQLCEDVSTLRFADDSRVRYTLRLNIGVLGGLAVGWFIDPTAEGSVVANLSPLALAFVAGYGSDLLFAVLDRIVGAFSTQPPAAREAAMTPARSQPLGAFTAGLAGADVAGQRGKHGNGLDAEPAMAH
jgi:hypothetical protein